MIDERTALESALEAALLQRVRLYERLLADAYGEQRGWREGWYDGGHLWSHPGYARALCGWRAPSPWLSAVRFDWAPTLRAQLQGWPQAAPGPALSPGAIVLKAHAGDAGALPLARRLALPCVPHHALQAVGQQLLWTDAGDGPQVVHALLRTCDDAHLDPLDLAPANAVVLAGVPGLVPVLRSGGVRVINAPGAAWLEAPWVEASIVRLCAQALGEQALPWPVDALATPGAAIVTQAPGRPALVQGLPAPDVLQGEAAT
jgi:uncharacterized circularly permuted ATP-grasp superfamily protein